VFQSRRALPVEPHSRRRLVGPLGSALTALALVALSTACSSSNGTEAGRYGPGTPTLGSCHRLTPAIIAGPVDASAPVPCSDPHTSVTIQVGHFAPSDITAANARSGNLGSRALAGCTAAWQHTVGGDASAQHTTVLSLAYFLPTSEQLSDDARWYRCDLILGGQSGEPLQNLPSHVEGLLSGTVPDSLRACRTSPNLSAGHEVPCTASHVLRAIGIAPLTGSGYPSATELRSQSEAGCTRTVRSWLHGRVGGGVAFEWPSQSSWQLLNDHDATCWTVTTS
jgi:hypothetical protein